MDFDKHTQLLRNELEAYYSSFDPDTKRLLTGLKDTLESHPEDSSYARKSRMHEYMCEECAVTVFRYTPLFFEMSSGRTRSSWGGLQSPVGSYLHQSTAHLWLNPYADALQKERQEGYFHGWNNPVGFDHHCAGYSNLLNLGLRGIIQKAEHQLGQCTDTRKQQFYKSIIRSNRALIHLAQRFSERARLLAAQADNAEEKAHYEFVADAASRVPENPPRTFYEALTAIVFYRECVGSLEGIGISTFSLLDRMLYPYYTADLDAGRITHEQARYLIADLLIYTDIRFDAANAYHETSTTIELGGYDSDGSIVYNELTEIILQTVIDVRAVGTKINCRISGQHPMEYLEKIMDVQLANLPSVMMHNDDVLIPARIKWGQSAKDACWYVGCGCHEIVLANTEVCTRADSWINLPRILLESMRRHGNALTFDEFYADFLKDASTFYNRIVALKNEGERYWCTYDPLPLYSSSLTGPLESGKDATEGGALYNTTSLSMLGAATLIDSLYCIKQIVFDEKRLDLPRFLQILENDFNGEEHLHRYILNNIPKHGTNHDILNRFSADILQDLSGIAGQTNARGGTYLPAFYPHDIYRPLGHLTGATPDGRKAHTPLSRGISPSEFIETESPLNVVHSLASIDFTRFAESFIAEITLPEMESNEVNRRILTSIVQVFLEAGGSSIQFNLLNTNHLREAQRSPEQHKNLLVRVCGYSAAFVHLNRDTQDEIIRRAIR